MRTLGSFHSFNSEELFMRFRTYRFMILGFTLVTATLALEIHLNAQQPQDAPKEEILMPEDMTRILKEEWQYLKDETDAYLKTVEKKAEFETKAEYDDRVGRLRQTFVSKVNSHIAEKKFDKRVFAVLLKANLDSYSPDTGKYTITVRSFVEAPYNTPTIKCTVPPNNYVGLADSIRQGYRSSALYLKFLPNFKWTTGRDAARIAKSDEANIFFRVSMVVDLNQAGIKNQANIKIIPKEISLVNRQNQQKLWDGGQIRLNPPKPRPAARKKAAPKDTLKAVTSEMPRSVPADTMKSSTKDTLR